MTGAAGFVGLAVVRAAAAAGWTVRPAVRSAPREMEDLPEPVAVGEIGPETDWSAALVGVEAVVHLAARVHVMRETHTDPDAAFGRVNVQGTERLARAAAAAGARRLVFVSSVKVHGERTPPGRPFTESDPPSPEDAYGRSKLAAERVLRRVAGETGLEIVVVRPPLVYGPRVGGNFLRLLAWVSRGVPLPLGRVANRRSLVGLDNLADLVVRCARHPAAAGETYLVSDGEALSTPGLIRSLAHALGRPARLVNVPVGLLRLAAGAVGRGDVMARLCDSLAVDADKARRELDWRPPVSLDEGLDRVARWYRSV